MATTRPYGRRTLLAPASISLTATVLLWSACSPRTNVAPGPSTGEIFIFAAASAAEPVARVARLFEQETGVVVRVNLAASSTLAQQIQAGAPADVFLSANEAWVDAIEEEGLVSHRTDYLANSLVVIVPRDSTLKIEMPVDLLAPEVARIAIGDPHAVPAGIYARRALTRLGVWDEISSKTVAGLDVRQTLLYVERGDVEAGVVYLTDTAITAQVRVAFSLDGALGDDVIRYPLVLTRHGADSVTAKMFFDMLLSEAGKAAFREAGFEVLAAADESK